jgi:glyoxylase-like metal-dependent hydrolase (beta-lactamase superfamily II)
MPKIIDLGRLSEKLKDTHLFIGEGLCSNIYVIGREQVIIIDPGIGNETNQILPQLKEVEIDPKKIHKVILTHAHHDHAMGAFIILEKTDSKILLHNKETTYIATKIGDSLIKINEGDIINTELWPLEVIWTPGHTGGSICLYVREYGILFSGDTVFPGGNFGRFDGESGSYKSLLKSLSKLTKLDVDIILPGHGVPVLKNAKKHIEISYKNALNWGKTR